MKLLVANVCSQQHARSDTEYFSKLASLVFAGIDPTVESYGSRASQLDCSCLRDPFRSNTFVRGEHQGSIHQILTTSNTTSADSCVRAV
jgi:hypothetical protein